MTALSDLRNAYAGSGITPAELEAWVERNARRVAAEYDYDVFALQKRRDFSFWGNSTDRITKLPVWQRALEIAQTFGEGEA